jgi:4-hydroxy-tetrahydrodipicolinate synthase
MFFSNGVYTVLVTPFTNEDAIDYDSILKWLDIQYSNKEIAGLVLLGTTSESPVLSYQEKLEIVKFIHHCNNTIYQKNQKKIIIGVGGNYTKEVIEFTKQIQQYADGIMVTVPYYNKPPQRGIAEHFNCIAKTFPDMPIMMYNVPGRTGINMEPETMIDVINSCPNIVALKEANGDLILTKKFIDLLISTNRVLGITFKIFSGDDINVVQHYMMGASGVISVASNIIPKEICFIVSL